MEKYRIREEYRPIDGVPFYIAQRRVLIFFWTDWFQCKNGSSQTYSSTDKSIVKKFLRDIEAKGVLKC